MPSVPNVTVPEPVTIPKPVPQLVPVGMINPFNAMLLLVAVGCLVAMFMVFALFPKESWLLLRAKYSKRKVPCIVANDAGIARLELCEPEHGSWLRIKKDVYPIVDTEPHGLAKKRYVLPGVKKPVWFIYETKALAMTPEHLKLLVEREASGQPVELDDPEERKVVLLLDPRDVRKDVKLRIHKSILAYMLRNAEAAGFEEGRKGLDVKTAMVFAMMIIAAAIAFAIVYGVVFGPKPVSGEIAKQVVTHAKNITLG